MFGNKKKENRSDSRQRTASSSPSSTTTPQQQRRRRRNQFKAALLHVSQRAISHSTFSSGGIPRSFLQQTPPQPPSQQQSPPPTGQKSRQQSVFGSLLSPDQTASAQRKTKTRGQMALEGVSLDQYRDAQDFASLFTSENLDKYPFLGMIYDQVKAGNIAGATETLYTVTRTIQQDLGEDPALQSIYNPDKHKNFAQALGEFIFNDTEKNVLPKPVAPKVQIVGLNQHNPDQKEQQSADPNPFQILSSFNSKNTAKPKSVLADQFIKSQHQHSTNQPHSPLLPSGDSTQPKKKVYKSSPEAPKQLTPSQWKQLERRFAADFDNFENPSFMMSRVDQTGSHHKALKNKSSEPTLASLTEKNPWYLPDGKLNVAYIRANAQDFDESHARFIKDEDLPLAIDILEAAMDNAKTPYEEEQDMLKQIEQRSIAEGHLSPHSHSSASKLTHRSDPTADRAQSHFGSQFGENLPTTAQLVSQVPKHVAKFQADRHRIDSQLGGPLLDELTMVSKLTPEDREKMGIDPLRGSLSLLTAVDVERIKKEYNFSNPDDVVQYIMRFLGRTAAEVDHQYNLPRHKYEELQIEYEAIREKDLDIKAIKTYADLDVQHNLKTRGYQMDPKIMKSHHAMQLNRLESDEEDGENPYRTMQRELGASARAHLGLKKSSAGVFDSQEIKRPDGSILKVGPDGQPVVIPPEEVDDYLKQSKEDREKPQEDDDSPAAAGELIDFLGQKVGGNADDTAYMDDWLTNSKTKRQAAVGLAGVFGGVVEQIAAQSKLQDQQLKEIESGTDPRGRSAEEIEMDKKAQLKHKHRQEYENSLSNLDRAKLRAMQIALKIGKQNDPLWVEAKEKQIYKLFEVYQKADDRQAFDLFSLSPEQRAQRIIKKTKEKMDMLYQKYLPKPTPEEEQEKLQDQLDQLKARGNKAKLEEKVQKEAANALLESNLEQMNQTQFALKQRQDALIRRQREIAMHQRALEWAATGKTPEEIFRLEEAYAAEMAMKGIDTNPITAEMNQPTNTTEHQIRRLLDEAKSIEAENKKPLTPLLESSPKAPETSATPLLSFLQNKQHTQNTQPPSLPQQDQGNSSATGINSGFINVIGKTAEESNLGGLVPGQGTAATETKSLLGSVQRRKLLRDLKTKTQTDTIPQLDANGVIQISPEEFQRRVDVSEDRKRVIEEQRREQKRLQVIDRMKHIDDSVADVHASNKALDERRREEDIKRDILATARRDPTNTAASLIKGNQNQEGGQFSKNRPKASSKDSTRQRFTTGTAEPVLSNELEWDRYQEEVMMKSLLVDPINSTQLDKLPPNIDHLLTDQPHGANLSPNDLVLPTKNRATLRSLQERNNTRHHLTLADVDPQKAKELKALAREVELLKQAQGLILSQNDPITAETNDSTIDTKIDHLRLEKILLEQNAPVADLDIASAAAGTNYDTTMMGVNNVVLDSSSSESAPSQKPQEATTFTPEDETGLKELLGADYIPHLDKKSTPSPRPPSHPTHAHSQSPQSSDEFSDQAPSPLTRSVLVPDAQKPQIAAQEALQPTQFPEKVSPPPKQSLDPAAKRRAQKEAKRAQKAAETQQQIESLIQPARINALVEAEEAMREEKRRRDELEANEREHREAMEKNQARLSQKRSTTPSHNTQPNTNTPTPTPLEKKRKELGLEDNLNSTKVGGENITAVDTALSHPATGKITSHASALDAFFADTNDFGSLFGAEAGVDDTASPHALEAESIKNSEAKLAQKLAEIDQNENFIELETAPASVFDEKTREARRIHEERETALAESIKKKKQTSNLSLLSRLEDSKKDLMSPFERLRPQSREQSQPTDQSSLPPSPTTDVLTSTITTSPLTPTRAPTPMSTSTSTPTSTSSSPTSITTPDLDQPPSPVLLQSPEHYKQRTKSVFEKLDKAKKTLEQIHELQANGKLPIAIDPSVPNTKRSTFSLTNLTMGFDDGQDDPFAGLHDGDEISEEVVEHIDDLTGLPTKITTRRVKIAPRSQRTAGTANAMATAFKRGSINNEQKAKVLDWLHSFRASLGLPRNEALDRKDFARTPLLPPHLMEEFEGALLDTHQNTEERHRLEVVAAQKKGYKVNSDMPTIDQFRASIENLKRDDPDAFHFMFSVLYDNGGNVLLIMSRAFGQAQRDVQQGRIKNVRDFRLALEKYGLTKEMISTMGKDVERLFDDLEADRLGLDQGGELVADEGTPIVQDPLADVVANAKRPIYGDGATDLNLVAVMKRKERSTIFNNLDEEVDNQMEQEVIQGKGIFQALAQKSIPSNLSKITSIPTELIKSDADKYKSKLPQYLDPQNKNADKFDDFFTPAERSSFESKLAPEVAPGSRTSVFQGLLKAIDTDDANPQSPKKQQFELTPDLIGGTITPFPGRLTQEEHSHLDSGIRNRLEVLVDRISRHTLLSPALVLEKMESPREFGKLLSLLTPDMVEEMKLVDALLDEDAPLTHKKNLLEFADVKNAAYLSDNQIFNLLPDLQADVKNLWEQAHSKAPRDVVFNEDKDRAYLKGFIDPHVLGLEAGPDGTVTPHSWKQRLLKYLPEPSSITDPEKFDWEPIAKQILEDMKDAAYNARDRRDAHEATKRLERYQDAPTPSLIDTLMNAEKSQTSLLDTINQSMAEKDKKLTNSLFRSIKEHSNGNERFFIVDRVKDRTSVIKEKRKLQLLRIKADEMKEFVKVHEITYNRLLANVEIMEEQLSRGLKPRPLFTSLDHSPTEETLLLEDLARDLATSPVLPSTPQGDQESTALATTSNTHNKLTTTQQLEAGQISVYDTKFARQQLDAFLQNPTTSPLAELLDLWSNPSTSQTDLDKLTSELAHTTFGRIYKIFGAFFPALPKKTNADVALSKFFERTPGASDEIEKFRTSLEDEWNREDAAGRTPTTEHTFGEGTQLGRLVRAALEETAIAQLPEETQKKIYDSKVELEKAFNDYRQLEIMYDRQARLFVLERERKQLGLPDFQELNMLKTKLDLILSTLQTPGLHNDKKQRLMDSAREIMTQTIAVRNLKDTDPEMFYWRAFLSKIPPKFHKAALNCHNMPIDPMRLFDDLNPGGHSSPEEVLANVLRFINENYRSTVALIDHVEHRATAQNIGSPTMTLRDLRKEQLACRRLLKFKDQVNDQRIGAKASLTKHYSENYIHQLRVMRVKQLMEEPDVNEVKRAELEFWLDESHQKGKRAGLRNALIQDLEDGVDSPIAAINPNPVALLAHKKMLKRRKATVEPILFNSKTGRLFSNDRLNPLIKYQKILQRRGERRKASLKRLAAEEELEPTELAAINAAREGNRLLSYLGTHGVGSTNLQKDIQDLLSRQAMLLEQQRELVENADVNNDADSQDGSDDDNGLDPDELSHKLKSKPTDTNPEPKTRNKNKMLNPQRKPGHQSSTALSVEVREKKLRAIDTQLAVLNTQMANIVAKKEDFDATTHIKHDAKDSSLVHIANQPFVYCRVVASYGQTVVVEQCGSNSYMKHAQFFVQDELQQIQRAAGLESVQLDNRDNLDYESDDEFDSEGKASHGKLIVPQHNRKRNAVRGNRRRWHCIKSRHMDLLCGDYVFIDPAPGRAWTSGANESTANSTLTAMNNTGADDHGLVKATFSRLNLLQKSGRSTSKLGHLEDSNPICANIDHMVILCAAEGQPAFSTSLIDRYLAAANFAGIKATIVYNKIDLIEMVSEAEKILKQLKEDRLTIHEKEKTLKKKMGKKSFKKMKRDALREQKKKLKDTHFYTSTMQRYMNKLLYSEALAKELQELEEEEQHTAMLKDQEELSNVSPSDLYHEDEHGRVSLKAPKKDYSVPALVKRQGDLEKTKTVHAIDYYYNDEEYDDEEEDRVLLEQQLERWITKKKRQVSREVEEKLREYERIGIKVIRVSAKAGVGVDELEQLLSRFHSTGFVGQSGVGKSSLLNAIIPDLDLQTSNITAEGKGQHTTTASRMFHLPNGGSVIDTPGSQSFVPPAVDHDYVQELFPEIKALAKFCKLGQKCVHTKEIGCAVREAVGDGSNRAIIPVTITELFDPMMMTNIRVQEFRSRLESGELRDIANNYAGNDPVLLYAQRFYSDLDSGKIITPSVHTHIPLDTAIDLGASIELDERGQAQLHTQEDIRHHLRFAQNPTELERSPAHAIPLEDSDFESDGQELPYEVRKVKHANRQLVDMIKLKIKHFGDDARFTDEEDEYAQNEAQLEELMTKHTMLKAYRASGGVPGDQNDPYLKMLRDEKSARRADRVKRREAIAQGRADDDAAEFDFNFNYNIEAMTQEVLRLQKADLIFEAEHMDEAAPNSSQVKEELLADARKTAIALAEIDLQDRLKRHNERKQKRRLQVQQEQDAQQQQQSSQQSKEQAEEASILKYRAERLGISVEKLLEMQELIQAQRRAHAAAEAQRDGHINSEDNSEEHEDEIDDHGPTIGIYDSPVSSKKPLPNKNNTNQTKSEPSYEYSTQPLVVDTQLDDIDEFQEAVFEPLSPEGETPRSATDPELVPGSTRPLSRKDKYAQLQYQTVTRQPTTQEQVQIIFETGMDARADDVEGAAEATADYILKQNESARDAEAKFREANQPLWRQQRDKLTQRRFGSRLPANANAYIPQFRYDNYIAMVELMKKTEQFMEKRKKKKSLTKQEEQKLAKQTRQAQLYEKRQIQRRRLLMDTDPYNAGADMRALENQSIKDPLKALSPAQMDWFAAKLGHKDGVAFPGKLSLLEGDKTKPIRKGKSEKVQDREYYDQLINDPDSVKDDKANDDDVRSFQHQMMSTMSAIYDERRKDFNNPNRDNGHADHYQRTKMLKKTWSEIQAQTERGDMLARMTQSDYLARTKYGGTTNHYGHQFDRKKIERYSDESEETYLKRAVQSPTESLERQKLHEDHGIVSSDIEPTMKNNRGTTYFGQDQWQT